MKHLLRILALGASVWLAGCTSPGAIRSDANTGNLNAEPAERAVSPSDKVASLFPAGGLKPLSSSQLGSKSVHALLPPADLWDRIRRGFAMPDLNTELVSERELWYSSRPDYVARMTERGNKYLFYIVEELERRNMPSELALLPFIESAFNPQAVSRAKAAGMWQFMPATGRQYELKQNMFRDDRRDVIESTRAALNYLQKLYAMFGDWHLALAAYNWGEGSVKRAIDKATRAGTGTGYPELNMPMETRLYVPKLQAVKNIVTDPASFRITLPVIENHPYFQTVTISRDLDVALAAKLAEVPLPDFQALNPSLNKPVLLAAGTPQILLPWDNAERFQANLEAYSGGRLANWTAWIAPHTLNPAEAAKQVGMSETELRSINQIPARMLIKAGSTLLVRRAAGLTVDVSVHVADNGQLSLAPDVVLKKTVVKASKGDNVTRLAQRYRVSANAVADWNNVAASASFKLGQAVVVYLPVAAAGPRQAKGTNARSAKAPGKRLAAKASARVKPKTASKKPLRAARK